MSEHVYIGELASAIVYLMVGVRLARLAARTGESPERLLAATFLLTGVSYFLYAVVPPLEGGPLWVPVNFTARILYIPAPVLLAIFTRQVFRQHGGWARWLVYATAALLVAGVVGSVLVGDWEGFSIQQPWFWCEWLGYTLPFGWAGSEAFIQFRQSRRRLELGLCDRTICNRLLLWSGFGTMQVLASLLLIQQYAAYAQENLFTAMWDAVIAGVEITSLVLMWFIFFAPAAYQRWVTAGDSSVPAAES